jgi:hypothetical protein
MVGIAVRPPGRAVTAQGHPRVIFKRAIASGSVVIAEATAREFALTLEEALHLVLLYEAYEPAKLERAALRWFRRYLDEGKGVTLLSAQVGLSALAELRGGERDLASEMLEQLVRR